MFAKQILVQIVEDIYTPFLTPGPAQPVNVDLHIPGQGDVQFQMLADELERVDEVQVQLPGIIGRIRIQTQDPRERDDIENYSKHLLQWFSHLMEFQDAIKEGDIM